jgi:RHH-type proline utilization regulon transcriptional repressor/proline dehydrogenase/delta 1-pyrroline-5-carboxylate dehydrogenase
MEIVERLPYALTGGLFARDPEVVRLVRSRTPVGNLYVNRGITGAKVGRQPFGGNRLSGNGLKAGGPGYLFGFVEPQAFTENTMRHGLVA